MKYTVAEDEREPKHEPKPVVKERNCLLQRSSFLTYVEGEWRRVLISL